MKNALLKRGKAISAKHSGFGRTLSAWMLLALFSLLSAEAIAQQTKTVRGTVIDEYDQPIIGANVMIDGATQGTSTDAQGNFTLSSVPVDGSLQVSFIGFVTQVVPVSGTSTLRIVLPEDTQRLEQVVVVGYGVQKKSDVTGAMVSVSAEDLTSRPITNALEGLQGRAAGVDITSGNRPGELGKIYIRGQRSLKASSDPLYVVDGIPLMSSSQIETINPQDIESIDILKDASATAIYGSRGANGVVLVTTKRGTEGKFTINYAGSLSFEKMAWKSRYMNAEQMIDFTRWAYWGLDPTKYSRGDNPSPENDEQIFNRDNVALNNVLSGWNNGTWDASRVQSTDWIDMVTQSNYTMEHTLSVSGGTQNMKAYGSIGYLDNQGTTKGQGYKRYTAKASIDITPKKWFEMGMSLTATLSQQNYGQSNVGTSGLSYAGNLIGQASRLFPYTLPYDQDGNVIQYPGGENRVPTVVNEWEYSINKREIMRILGSMYFQLNLLDGLKYRMNFGPDFRYRRLGIYNDSKSVVTGGASFGQWGVDRDFSWTVDNLLYYDKVFGKHTIGITALQTASSWNIDGGMINARNIPFAEQRWYALDKKNIPQLNDWSTKLEERQLMSWMGRINYGFNEKYLITVSGRWDGASQLAPGNKWAFFPSAAFAWRIEQEEFLKPITWIDQLKLRLGYGVTGNSAIDPYKTKGDINSMYYPYGSDIEQGYVAYDRVAGATNVLQNPNLGWEKTAQFNVGLDFALFRGRLSGGLDVYTSKTTDLLMEMVIPSLTGYATTFANIGSTKNFGVDFTLNSINIQNRDFSWSTTLTGAWQREKIEELANGKEDMLGDADNIWLIGQPINIYYGYEGAGIWQDTPEDQAEMAKFNANGHQFKPGMSRPKDQNNDYQITANDDRVMLGRKRPDWVIGFNNTFSYRNWDLTIFMNGRLGYLADTGQSLTAMYGDQRMLDYWTPNNPTAKYQMPIKNEAGGDPYYKVNHYRDNSYIAIKNISLGYRLPKTATNKLGIDNARVYVQVRDPEMLWSKIKYHWADSYSGNSLWWNRGFIFGLNIGF